MRDATAMVYRWRTDRYEEANAQRVGETLLAIASDNGGELRPQDVVAAARAETSPLHGCFEWDDRKAAREHRLQQARQLVTALVVVVPDAGRVSAFTRATTKGDGDIYVVSSTDPAPVFSMPQRTPGQQLAQAWRELKDWRLRYGHLDALAPIVTAIEAALGEDGRERRGEAGK